MTHQHVSCSLDQLIEHLTLIKHQHSGVNKVIFWDQVSAITIPLNVLCTVQNDVLYVGGLHVNGNDCCDLDPFVIDNAFGDYPKKCSVQM